MCIISVSRKATNKIKDLTIDTMGNSNPHGFGFAYVKDKKIKIYKTMSLKDFKEKFSEINGVYPNIAHYRYATHGTKNTNNCHPFLSKDKRFAFMHNGIIDESLAPNKKNEDKTDSQIFFEKCIYPIIKEFETNNEGNFNEDDIELLQNILDIYAKETYSRFAIICIDGTIISTNNFIKDDGIEYSNTSFRAYYNNYYTNPCIPNTNYKSTYQWGRSVYDDHMDKINEANTCSSWETEKCNEPSSSQIQDFMITNWDNLLEYAKQEAPIKNKTILDSLCDKAFIEIEKKYELWNCTSIEYDRIDDEIYNFVIENLNEDEEQIDYEDYE